MIAKGYQALEIHSRTTKHQQNVAGKLPKCQLELQPQVLKLSTSSNANTSSVASSPSNSKNEVGIPVFCCNDGTSKSEILWMLKVVVSNYNLRSCDDMNLLFAEMFPNDPEIKSMTLKIRQKLDIYLQKYAARTSIECYQWILRNLQHTTLFCLMKHAMLQIEKNYRYRPATGQKIRMR